MGKGGRFVLFFFSFVALHDNGRDFDILLDALVRKDAAGQS